MLDVSIDDFCDVDRNAVGMDVIRDATPSPRKQDAVRLFHSMCDRCNRSFGSPSWPTRGLCDVCHLAQMKILHRAQYPVLRQMPA